MTEIRYENAKKAIKNNSQKDLKKCIDLGFDVNTRSPWGLTLLHEACLNNNHEMVKLLLSYGANANEKTFYGEDTPLVISIRNDCVENVKILLENFYNNNPEVYLDIDNSLLSEANLGIIKTILEKYKFNLSDTMTVDCLSSKRERL